MNRLLLFILLSLHKQVHAADPLPMEEVRITTVYPQPAPTTTLFDTKGKSYSLPLRVSNRSGVEVRLGKESFDVENYKYRAVFIGKHFRLILAFELPLLQQNSTLVFAKYGDSYCIGIEAPDKKRTIVHSRIV